ncbi:hypothetical protein Tco_0682658 [Tanacetum coccineum]|uniref:Uncharacterized protein n=1 Tax=Tanacetum coccineum TaxID=301880 RepID=A0ABQ4XT69_9ASTR
MRYQVSKKESWNGGKWLNGSYEFVWSGCTTALNVVPWETDGESVLREACPTRACSTIFYLFLHLSFIVSVFCFYPIRMNNTQTPHTATTVVNTTGAPVTNTVANHAEKPEKFNGQKFKRW